ncbi:MAG: hypothetical protein ACI8W7_002396 [Gammaproteobacteria bacterium]|jgi:hypothetical protein
MIYVEKRRFLRLVSLMLAGVVMLSDTAATTTTPAPPPCDVWAKVLGRFVDSQGRVDFAAIANDRADLDRFVSYVSEVAPSNQSQLFPSRQHVLAFHINAYNALAMHRVVEKGIPQSLSGGNAR